MVLFACLTAAYGSDIKRLVVVKIDGLPAYYVDKYVKANDPATGKSYLPWIKEIYYKNGTRLNNFYSRGLSLSGPSWGLIDTGQHLQIKSNADIDRYTLKSYDYLNVFPFYVKKSLNYAVDMPAVETLDEVEIPLLADAFPSTKVCWAAAFSTGVCVERIFKSRLEFDSQKRWGDIGEHYDRV